LLCATFFRTSNSSNKELFFSMYRDGHRMSVPKCQCWLLRGGWESHFALSDGLLR